MRDSFQTMCISRFIYIHTLKVNQFELVLHRFWIRLIECSDTNIFKKNSKIKILLLYNNNQKYGFRYVKIFAIDNVIE